MPKGDREILQPLIEAIGYDFKDESLLKRALTRTSAIIEHVHGSADYDYQALELVGDAALKSVLTALVFRTNPAISAEQLHDVVKPLITNDGIMVKIAKSLSIGNYLIKGKGEGNITNKMRVDALEAILGAVNLDSICNKKGQKGLIAVIEKLWGAYLPKNLQIHPVPIITTQQKEQVSSSSLASCSQPCPLSPRRQRVFSGVGGKTTLEDFEKYVGETSDINCQNVGEKGDTALIMICRKDKICTDKELPKIELLIKHGALWDAPNNNGETARTLLEEKNPEIAKKLIQR